MSKTSAMPARVGLTAALLASAACGDEGVTHIDGPFPVLSIDSGMDQMDDASAGDSGGETFPPCPTGYTCMDLPSQLAASGAQGTVTDPEGNPIRYACAKSGQEACLNPMDPTASCSNLPQAFCAHVTLTAPVAIELDQCAQKCSP